MKKAGLLLLLFLAAPGIPLCRAEPPAPARGLDQPMLAQVAGTALAFMAPRTLDPIGMPQLALWGLQGLTTLDPLLRPALAGETLSLSLGGAAPRRLLSRQAPPAEDADGWGDAVAQTVRAAWDASEAVRRAGTQGVINYFFNELFNHMDPYSRYAGPHEAAADRIRRNGRAEIGLTLARRGGGFVVGEVQAGSPASQAGIRPGERILAIDGQTIQGLDRGDAGALLAGPEHSHVLLTLRDRDGSSRTLELERIRVPPETVTARRIGDMQVLRISGFSSDTASRLAQELIRGQAERPPPRGVVLDLRGNRGGLLQQAVASAAMLQQHGVVAITAGRDPDAAHVFLADSRDLADFLPVVVLVDGSTASAAEILAAALADQHRAVVVGSATLGKGLVQTVTGLPDGGELLVTWSRVLAPAGWPIQDLGVLPQVCTSLGPAILAHQLDELAHGRQPMQAALARQRATRAPLPPATAVDIRAACPAASGRDADLGAARFLIATPLAYRTALLAPALMDTATSQSLTTPGLTARGLTGAPAMRN